MSHAVILAGRARRSVATARVPAVWKPLERAEASVDQLDLAELKEAFASLNVAVVEEFVLDRDKVNVNGGAIVIGHPLGMSGTRLVVYSSTSRGSGTAIWFRDALVCVGQRQARLTRR